MSAAFWSCHGMCSGGGCCDVLWLLLDKIVLWQGWRHFRAWETWHFISYFSHLNIHKDYRVKSADAFTSSLSRVKSMILPDCRRVSPLPSCQNPNHCFASDNDFIIGWRDGATGGAPAIFSSFCGLSDTFFCWKIYACQFSWSLTGISVSSCWVSHSCTTQNTRKKLWKINLSHLILPQSATNQWNEFYVRYAGGCCVPVLGGGDALAE